MLLQDASPELLRNDVEFLVRVSLFGQIEPEARLEILRTRAEIVRKRIAHAQEMRALAQEHGANGYAEEVIAFQKQQGLRELEWIQSLIRKV
jgi:hypothetical protein